jgi:hypothetical protein
MDAIPVPRDGFLAKKIAGQVTGLSNLSLHRLFTPKHTDHALLIIPRIREITANTIRTWISPPTL